MARLVVLRFEKDDEADEFVEAIVKGYDYELGEHWKEMTAEGLYQAPTKFHEPDHKSSGWRWGPKHNWQICHDCGMPSVGYANNHKAIVFDSYNLLEEPSGNSREREQLNDRPKVNPETGVVWELE